MDVDPRIHVPLNSVPGPYPDLRIKGQTIAVKSTELWNLPLTLYYPLLDPSDIAILVSVDLGEGKCGLQGYAIREDRHNYPKVTNQQGRIQFEIPHAALISMEELCETPVSSSLS
jgi:hypothetical protein